MLELPYPVQEHDLLERDIGQSLERSCRCQFDRVEIPARPIVRVYGQQRRLRQESRTLTVVALI